MALWVKKRGYWDIEKYTFPRAREWAKWASERTSERSGGREWSEQSRVSGTPVQPPGYQEYDRCDLGLFWGYKIRVKWAHSQLSRWSGTFFRVHLKIVEKKFNKTEFEGLSLLIMHKIKLNHHEPEKLKMILDNVEPWIEVWWIISLPFHCRDAGMAHQVLPCSLLKVWFLELNVSSKNVENNFCVSWLTVESGSMGHKPYIWW